MAVSLTIVGVFAVSAWVVWDYGQNFQWWGQTPQVRELCSIADTFDDHVPFTERSVETSQPVGVFGKRTQDWVRVTYRLKLGTGVAAEKDFIHYLEEQGFSNREDVSKSGRILLERPSVNGRKLTTFISIQAEKTTEEGQKPLATEMSIFLSYE